MPHLAMQRKRRWWALAAVALLLLAVPPPKRAATTPVVTRQLHVPAGATTAGAAELPLPVPADVHLAGYGPFRTAKGLRDPPMARALVIGPWVIVALDLLEVSPELVQAIREKLPEPTALFVLATHTHSGPGGTDPNLVAQLLGEGAFHRNLMNAFATTAVTAVALARANEEPALLSFARSSAPGLQEERDPGGTPDPSLTVLSVDRPGGKPIATLVVFGAHPTLLPRQERLLSADWPGAAVRELEKSGGVAMVVQGAGGDASVPRPGLPEEAEARIQAYGERFAAAALRRFRENPDLSNDDLDLGIGLKGIAYASAQVTLPAPNLSAFLPLHGAADRLVDWLAPATAQVAVVRVGSLLFYCLPGELTGAAHALEGLAFHPGEAATALSLCNGDISYIESPDLWRNGQGERLALFGPDLAERLFEGVRVAAEATHSAGR